MKTGYRSAARVADWTACTLGCALLMGAGVTGTHVAQAQTSGGNTIPLPIKLPKPVFAGTPTNQKVDDKVEKPLGRPRPVPMVPAGTVNVALHKKVTSSKNPLNGTLDMITDGNKEAREDTIVEITSKGGPQWVQIDLGESDSLSYIVVWHFHNQPIIFHDVVVQLSNDPDFKTGVTTVFNNDQENVVGQGIGKDREYFETNEGKLIDAKGAKARYVRLYSNKSTANDPLNRYTEVEVYGVPSK